MKAVRLLLVAGAALAAVVTAAPAASAAEIDPVPDLGACFIVSYPDGSHGWICL